LSSDTADILGTAVGAAGYPAVYTAFELQLKCMHIKASTVTC